MPTPRRARSAATSSETRSTSAYEIVRPVSVTYAVASPNRRAASRAVWGSMGSGSHNVRGKRGAAGTPARQRELRAQGRKTMRRLSDAGMRVFAERGYHQSRVDDIVRAARTSHGTFYLYFANKEDLLRALAVDCAAEMEALAARIEPID